MIATETTPTRASEDCFTKTNRRLKEILNWELPAFFKDDCFFTALLYLQFSLMNAAVPPLYNYQKTHLLNSN